MKEVKEKQGMRAVSGFLCRLLNKTKNNSYINLYIYIKKSFLEQVMGQVPNTSSRVVRESWSKLAGVEAPI